MDVSSGNIRKLVAETNADEWAAWVKVLETYGKEYFCEFQFVLAPASVKQIRQHMLRNAGKWFWEAPIMMVRIRNQEIV